MSTVEQAINRCRSLALQVQTATRKQAQTIGLPMDTGFYSLSQFRDAAGTKERYTLFRGWLYSAINALASEAASRPVQVARVLPSSEEKKSVPRRKKAVVSSLLSGTKRASDELEILWDHPVVDLLEAPNEIQGRWQFVYSFVSHLCLTGWSYVVGGYNEDSELNLYSLPTTWIRPDHKEGPFSRFKVSDPNNPTFNDDPPWLTRENVAFAHLPNPADPRSAYAPAQSQIQAIRIDDHIQASQERFFENGIFPGAIVTIGKDPHPDVPGGIRPRLTAEQRRQVMAVIRKLMSGVANYGNPAIVDGMIEKIERLTMTSNEMGWDKSEDKVRTRILSAFGVHPYILGEPVSVGGYAQAAKIEERFCKRVNAYLEMLSVMLTNFLSRLIGEEDLVVWWEPAAPHDPALRWKNLNAARVRGDISRNEIRAELGLPPDETGGGRTRAFTTGDVNAIVALQAQVAQGLVSSEQAAAIYEVAFDLEPEAAARIAGARAPAAGELAQGDEIERAARALALAVESLGLEVADYGAPEKRAMGLIEAVRCDGDI